MRKRILRIMLLPFAILIFLVGWFLYIVGDRVESKTRRKRRLADVAHREETVEGYENMEVGLIEEALEEQPAD